MSTTAPAAASSAPPTSAVKFTYQQFEQLCGPQLVGSRLPQSYWKSAYEKLSQQIFDAGNYFCLAAQEAADDDEDEEGEENDAFLPNLLVAVRDLDASDVKDQVFLLDHAWTFRAAEAQHTLETNAELCDRVSTMLLGAPLSEFLIATAKQQPQHKDDDDDADADDQKKTVSRRNNLIKNKLMPELWKTASHYLFATETSQFGEENCWYLLDEVGSAIVRTLELDEANVAMAPIFYPPAGAAFQLLWFLDKKKNKSDEERKKGSDDDDDGDDDDAGTFLVAEEGALISVDVAQGLGKVAREAMAARYEGVWGDLLCRLSEDDDGDDEEKSNRKEQQHRHHHENLDKWVAKYEAVAATRTARVEALLSKDIVSGAAAAENNIVPSLAVAAASASSSSSSSSNTSLPLKVWTDHDRIREFLSLKQFFVFVDNPSEANIIWSTYTSLPLSEIVGEGGTTQSTQQQKVAVRCVAEFNNEELFSNKYLMAKAMYETLGASFSSSSSSSSSPSSSCCGCVHSWLPLTFDASNELDAFLEKFLQNEAKEEKKTENFWISKPQQQARSRDMCISDDPRFLLRIGETGHKCLCEYVANPQTLRGGRKFDLRLVVLVRSFSEKSLEVYLHDKVWVRTAPVAYSLDDFHEYEKHFTTMNYSGREGKLLNLLHDDFIAEFEKEQKRNGEEGQPVWPGVFDSIKKMLRVVFTAISVAHGEELEADYKEGGGEGEGGKSCSHNIQRRAMYGIDVMLDSDNRPWMLEINQSPDVNRAARFFPTFIDDVFKTLFLGEPTSCSRLC